jgi:hypothetical protein
MYSINGVKLSKQDVESYRDARDDTYAKRAWWTDVKRRYNLNQNKRYKVRFVAVVLEAE